MIPEIERQAALALRPYFSSKPIVFDVGSNKGFWADVVIDNVAEIHLFEPNEMLLTYTKVKYDARKNVTYNPVAVFSEEKELNFYFFTDDHNGLSSVFNIPEWDSLGKQRGKVRAITLDKYCQDKNIQSIDFLKVDVEGADIDVMLGAAGLLKDKRIRFIQIENSSHYHHSGRTFQEAVDLVRPCGYDIFRFDGERFIKWNGEHDENLYIMFEHFTQNWNSEFIKNTRGIKVETALEIGCFEGLTTNYICNNILNPGGRIICIDPLTDEYLPGHKDNEMFVGQYDRFIRNTTGKPVELIRKKSKDAFAQLKDLRFGLIYIDGDHTEEGVFNDGVMYWNLLLDSPKGEGGYMLFDDYGQSKETQRGIDRFLETQKGNFDFIVKEYQVLIRRLW